jgi:hypothetical protein
MHMLHQHLLLGLHSLFLSSRSSRTNMVGLHRPPPVELTGNSCRATLVLQLAVHKLPGLDAGRLLFPVAYHDSTSIPASCDVLAVPWLACFEVCTPCVALFRALITFVSVQVWPSGPNQSMWSHPVMSNLCLFADVLAGVPLVLSPCHAICWS